MRVKQVLKSTVEPAVFERIALTRLPELQKAGGLFKAAELSEGGGDRTTVSELRSSAVVLLGLTRADEVGLESEISIGSLRTALLAATHGAEITPGDLGLAIWAESRADGSAVGELAGEIGPRIETGQAKLPLEQVAWLASGLSEARFRVGAGGELEGLLERVAGILLERSLSSGLLSDVHHRIGSGMSPVGGQLHALAALNRLVKADLSGAASVRDALLESLLELQREDGGWPGVLDAKAGTVIATYPMLTVNQIAVAPMALGGSREVNPGEEPDDWPPIRQAIDWACGRNALGFDLIHERESRIDHAILPRRRLGPIGRSVGKATSRLRGRPQEPNPDDLILDPALTSEDMGWLLEAWAGR